MNKGGNFLQQILKGIIAIVCLIILGIVAYLMMTPEDTASQAQTRQVTDATGQVLTIPVHPQRVVFLNVSNLDLYYAAGGRDTIAGKPTSDSMSPELADAMKDVPAVGIIHSPNMETILSLKPDLVIGVNVPFHNQIRQTLEQNGIPLYINSLDSLEDTGKTLRFFGELTGKEEEADARADEIQKRCDAVVEAASHETSPRSLIVFSSPESNNMATSYSFSGDLLKRLHGTNIANLDSSLQGPYVPLSMEYVIKNDPQAIFIISMGQSADELQRFRQSMNDSDAWSQVTAVREGRVYELPARLFTVNPGSHIADAMEYMSQCLYQGGTL